MARFLRPLPGIDFYSLAVQAKMMLKEPLRYNLHIHTPTEYIGMRCWAHWDGPRAAGFALDGDQLVNMFSMIQGRGDEVVQIAVGEGARRLDCYDGHLVELYSRHGFVIAERTPWDNSFADPRWDEARWGRPDVVHMRLEQ